MGEEKKRLPPASTVNGEDHGKGLKTASSSLLCDWKLFGAGRIQIGSEAEEVWHKPVTATLERPLEFGGKSLADSRPYSGMVRKCDSGK